ncbi:MAG: flippase-like domain-containing protein [Saprospiraceae bacterium]|nr:flippase-like domain-containing protein [Saprospiraceae bacterium]
MNSPHFRRFGHVILAIGLLGLLIWQISSQEDLLKTWSEFKSMDFTKNIFYLILALLLMPINWGIEIIKWKNLVSTIDKITGRQSTYAVLTGISMGIVTPARIGEYIGRLSVLTPEKRPPGVVLMFINSLAQNIINIFFGIFGILYFLDDYYQFDDVKLNQYFVAVCLLSILLISLYFNIRKVVAVTQKLPLPLFLQRWFKKLDLIQNVSNKSLVETGIYSLVRYFVYFLQYCMILKFFNLDLGISQMMAGIATIFMVQSGIPLPPLSAILARGEIALMVWGMYNLSVSGILAATFTLWVINLIIPALFGIAIILFTDYNSNSYEND